MLVFEWHLSQRNWANANACNWVIEIAVCSERFAENVNVQVAASCNNAENINELLTS